MKKNTSNTRPEARLETRPEARLKNSRPGRGPRKNAAANDPKKQRSISKKMHFIVKKEMPLRDYIIDVAMQGISRSVAKSYLSYRQVSVDHQVVTQFDFPLKKGMTLEISRQRGQTEIRSTYFKVLYEDAYLIIVDKRHGIPVKSHLNTKERSVQGLLLQSLVRRNKQQRLFSINHIDRDASGIVLYAKDEKTKQKMQDFWNDLVQEYRFVAVLEGKLEKDAGMVNSWLDDDRQALVNFVKVRLHHEDLTTTHYKKINEKDNLTLVELSPTESLRQQIRFHMHELHCPVVGDSRFGSKGFINTGNKKETRIALHAFKLVIHHPVNNELISLETFYPQVFKQLFL
ncbi:MAG: pseudouridine synthase [Bacteroidaceae bacterium]